MYALLNNHVSSVISRHRSVEAAKVAQTKLARQMSKLPGRCYLPTLVCEWLGDGACPKVGAYVSINDDWAPQCNADDDDDLPIYYPYDY